MPLASLAALGSIPVMMRLLLGCLVAATVAAEPAGQPFSVARLQAISQDIASLRVPFTQEKRLALFDEPVLSSGVIEISRPLAAVRWEYRGKSVLVLKGGRLRRWGAEGREETIGGDDPGGRAVQGQMQALLTGDWSALDDLFTVTPDAQGGAALTMAPKSPDLGKYIARIELVFRADLSAPQSLIVISADGDETLFFFGEPERNADIAAARFAGP